MNLLKVRFFWWAPGLEGNFPNRRHRTHEGHPVLGKNSAELGGGARTGIGEQQQIASGEQRGKTITDQAVAEVSRQQAKRRGHPRRADESLIQGDACG